MADGQKRWIIRSASGHIEGPFTTEKILYKIGRGEFSGEEHIAHYPDGQWIAISQDPQFYDKLLDVLSAREDQEASEITHILEFTRQEPTTQGVPSPSAPTSPPPTEDTAPTLTVETAPAPPLEVEAMASVAAPKKKKKKRRSKPEDIELVDTRPKVIQQILARAKLPVLVAGVALALGALFLFSSDRNEERIHLIAPQKTTRQTNLESMKPRLLKGYGEFSRDTLSGYTQAQNTFVDLVESNNKFSESLAALCMTYMQLWPYAYQDSIDTKAITQVVQLSSQADPAGVHSATCRTVDLITRSRYAEAKSLVESILETRATDANPPLMFYFLKGYLLEASGDHASAIGYLRSAQQLFPAWSLPYVVEAQAHTRAENYSQAATLYRRILEANPAHTVARVELGILEYKYFQQATRGERLLKEAVSSGDAPRPTLSRGYLGLAEMVLQRGDSGKALGFAQKAYAMNPSNAVAKNLIVQIGGVGKLKTTKLKGQQLLFEGDQYYREGDCHAAQAHYKAAFEADQKNALAAMKAAQCLWKMSFSTEAMEWLSRAIQADPKLIEAYVLLADYQAQRFNFLAAARVLEQARAANPKSHEVYRGFAQVELRRNNAQGAITFGKQALSIYDNDGETYILLAEASLLARDPKMAYNYAAKAVDLDVNHRRAQIVFARALAGLQGVDVGVDYLLKMVNNYPLVIEYRLALGQMLLTDERYQQAEEIFRQIIKLDDKPKEAYVELAKVLKAEGSMGEALNLLLKAAVLDPADAEPLFLAGNIYLELKRPQEASVQFQRVVTINKLYPLVQYQLGRAAMRMNDPRQALSFAEAEKRTNPNLADAYLLAAEAHTLLQQYSMCATEYQKAIKLRPQEAAIYVKIAQCYRKAGSLDAAIAMLNVAASKENGLADIYKEQGAIYEIKGDVTQAIEAYNQYFVLDPDAPDRSQIEARIFALQRGQRP